ncbi:type III-B CRISPR module RAMP protein Cmr4 [Roseiflexus sp.]|uniref:type III-B CRISPR module RAMP protein Cmr4 n=1 Tax=Roseiflexus sp. TaxID=2562120 RepID=UPI00398B8B9A
MHSPHLYFLHVLSPLHAGTGQGSGVIDLPIAREKSTGIPYLPGSSVKGVLRDKSGDNDLTYLLFGPKTEQASDYAGSLQIADARLLLLPVRALRGTFAWVTSPYVLRRFARDARDVGFSDLPSIPTLADDVCAVSSQTVLKVDLQRNGRSETRVVLEDLDLKPQTEDAAQWATWLSTRIFPKSDTEWSGMLAPRLCIVSDNVFTFLLSTAIEVIARNRLNDNKTVAQGALWYEEALPTESVLYGLAVFSPTAKVREHLENEAALLDRLNELARGAMQFGGKATVGRGLCRMRLMRAKEG